MHAKPWFRDAGRKRDRVWVAAELLAELDDLDRRIQAEMND